MSKQILTIFVADIWGNTAALQQLAQQVCNANSDYLILDPYDGQEMNFANQQLAYQAFLQVGLSVYAQRILLKLATIKQPFNLIGFSVGGSAVWLISAQLHSMTVNKIICFYAAQIRNHLDIKPSQAIQLILPESEPHFDIQNMSAIVSKKSTVEIIHSRYLHGFMNTYSANFHSQAYQHYIKLLRVI